MNPMNCGIFYHVLPCFTPKCRIFEHKKWGSIFLRRLLDALRRIAPVAPVGQDRGPPWVTGNQKIGEKAIWITSEIMKSPGFLWLTYPSEKYEFVSWDDYSYLYYGKRKNVWNHQPGNHCFRIRFYCVRSISFVGIAIVGLNQDFGIGFGPSTVRFFAAALV